MSLNFIKRLQGWKKSLLIISLIPILLLGFSFICYGVVFNSFFTDNGSFIDFFKIPNLFSIFKSDIALPTIVKLIGSTSTILLSVLFIMWFVLFTITCYLKLSQQVDNKIELITELVIISLVYFYIIAPSSIVSFLLGLLLIVINLGLIVLYWIYELKAKK